MDAAAVEETWAARLARYRTIAPSISGWLDDQIFEALPTIAEEQERLGVAGAIYEIGVYEGRFLLALDQLRRPGEALVAIDLFGLPVRSDGPRPSGSSALLANVAQYGSDRHVLTLVTADSTRFDADARAGLKRSHGAARLFSVDGDHAPASTLKDLETAAALLAPGGVVFLDDCFNPHFPGVQEGLARYMLAAPALAPFAHYGNKLLLTDAAHQAGYLAALLRRFSLDQVRRRLNKQPAPDGRPARCWGWPILSLRSQSPEQS